MAHLKHIGKIKEREFILIINEEYARAKRILKPAFKGINRSFITFTWAKGRYGGTCWTSQRQIQMNVKYRDNSTEKEWTREMFRCTLRHEFVHLSGAHRHNSSLFLGRLKALEGSRYTGQGAYQGTNPKK